MKTAKKATLLTVCALVLVAATVMGTMAYLTDTKTVTNTFAAATLADKDAFTLNEHNIRLDTEHNKYEFTDEVVTAVDYTVVPGMTLPKDPTVTVTVKADAYLFLEVIDTLPDGMDYTMDETQWARLMNGDQQVTKDCHPIYVRKAGILTPADGRQVLNVLTDKQVTVGAEFDPDTLTTEGSASKNLNFHAYLGQARADAYHDALGAWNTLFAK